MRYNLNKHWLKHFIFSVLVVGLLGCSGEPEGLAEKKSDPPPENPEIDSKVIINVSASEYTVTEGDNIVFVFFLSEPLKENGSFNWSIQGGDNDFATVQGSGALSVGQTTISVPIAVTNDAVYETAGESYQLVVSSSLASNTAEMTLHVVDDDTRPTLTTTSFTLNEDDGVRALTFQLSNASSEVISIDYSIDTGTSTATHGSDYNLPLTGKIDFPIGSTSANLNLTIVDDAIDEGAPEFIRLDLSRDAAFGDALLEDDYVYHYITDNDTATIYAYYEDTSRIRVDESNTTVQVIFRTSKVSGSDVDIDYIVGGTATNPEDHSLAPGTVTILAGQTSATLNVPILDETTQEPDHYIQIIKGTVTGATWMGNISKFVDIIDNDTDPIITMDAPTVSISESAAVIQADFTMSNPYGFDLTVNYSFSDNGELSRWHDYTYSSVDEVVVSTGNVTGSMTRVLLDDLRNEPDESFTFTLENGTGYSIGTNASTTITVLDNDAAEPTLNLQPVTQIEGCGAVFYAELSAHSGYDVTFDFATSDGTATAGLDYIARSGSYTIPKNRKGIGVFVELLNDGGGDADETFDMTLSNVSGATLGTAAAQATIKEALPSFAATTRLINSASTVEIDNFVMDERGCYTYVDMDYDQDEAVQTYYVDFFGSNVIPVSDEANLFGNLIFSPAFPNRVVVYGGEMNYNASALTSKNIDGTDVVELSPSGSGSTGQYMLTADNTKIAFTSGTNYDEPHDLFIVNFDGSNSVSQINDPFSNGGCIAGDNWDSTGNTAVFYADYNAFEQYQIYSQDVTTTTKVKLNETLDSYSDILDFKMSPDGSKVVYRADIDTDDTVDIYSVNLDGTGSVKLNTAPNAGAEEYVISPDSSTVVFAKSSDTLFKVPIGGGANTQIGDLSDGVYNTSYNPNAPDFDPVPPTVDMSHAEIRAIKISQDGQWLGVCSTDGGSWYEGRMLSYRMDGLASYDLSQAAIGERMGCGEFQITPLTNRFIFNDETGVSTRMEVWIVDADQGNPIMLEPTYETSDADMNLSVKSDESNLVLGVYNPGGDYTYIRMALDGTGRVTLADSSSGFGSDKAIYSRDTNLILYTSDFSIPGQYQLHIKNIE